MKVPKICTNKPQMSIQKALCIVPMFVTPKYYINALKKYTNKVNYAKKHKFLDISRDAE